MGPRADEGVLVAASGRSVAPQQRDQPSLHLDPVGREDAGLVARIGGLERDRVAAAAQALQRHLVVVDQGDDDLAVLGGLAAGG